LSGTTWFDRDGDGVRSPNEKPLAGVTIVLTGQNQETVRLVTDERGEFVATLAADVYEITTLARIEPTNGPALRTIDLSTANGEVAFGYKSSNPKVLGIQELAPGENPAELALTGVDVAGIIASAFILLGAGIFTANRRRKPF
jgi:hypothetical protein